MGTRTFKKTHANGDVVTIKLSEYGGELYVNGELDYSFCVENINDDIQALLDEGYEEVI